MKHAPPPDNGREAPADSTAAPPRPRIPDISDLPPLVVSEAETTTLGNLTAGTETLPEPPRRRALVTGSARGLGRAIALHLGRAGGEVAVHYRRSRPRAEETARDIRAAGGRAHLVGGDVGDPEQAAALTAEAAAAMGGMDVLINNAGEFLAEAVDEITPELWERQLASTVSGAFYVTRGCLPSLRESRGRIISISDSRAERIAASPRTLPYQIGKTGILILTRTLARTEARYGITVNALLPGVLENSDPPMDADRIPAGRLGKFRDVLGAVDYLLSPRAGYATGAFIHVGGGWNL